MAQSSLEYTVEQTYGRKLGHTKPLRDLISAARTNAEHLAEYKANRPHEVDNFSNATPSREGMAGALPLGRDPLMQDFNSRSPLLTSKPIVLVEGLSRDESLSSVPDVNGDVSNQYYVETVNATTIQVFDQAGKRVGEPFQANTIWEQVGFTSLGDPIILYDQSADRWILTEFPPSNRVLIAVSDSNDPLGAWTAYSFSTQGFPDYPKYGIWPETLLLTVNELGDEDLIFYGINREDILNGNDTLRVQRFGIPRLDQPGVQSAAPVGWIGDVMPAADAKPLVVRINDDAWGNTDTDQLELFEVAIDWDEPDSSKIEQIILPTTPFTSDFCEFDQNIFVCVPQPGTVSISAIPHIIWNKLSYRNFGTHSSIVLNFGVDVTGEKDAGIRWMELRKEGDEDWVIYQEGTVGSSDGENRFLGGISIDAIGNIGLAYAVSSEKTFPSLRYTGRLASDPLGIMTVEEVEFGTGKSSSTTSRYGDYQSMSVDRQNIFWFAGQYMPEGGFWSSKILGFRLQIFDSDIGPIAVVGPEDSPDLASEILTVTVKNFGFMPQTEFQIGYSFDGGPAVVEDVSIDSLFTDSVYMHTFQDEILFDRYGKYPLVVFTSMMSDSNVYNDTSDFVLHKQSTHDAELIEFDGVPKVVCDTFYYADIILRNAGLASLTSVDITFSVNGEDQQSIQWTGNLVTNEMTTVEDLLVSQLVDGSNDVSVRTSNPNGMDDQDKTNDTSTVNIKVMIGGIGVSLTLLTDSYPEDTSWELQDLDGNILFEDGPLANPRTEHFEDWCLDLDSCYVFVLYDSYGDGITAQGVSGNFVIANADGGVLASLGDPNFGSELATEFCVSTGCSLSATVRVSHETRPGAGNGLINIFGAGGGPPYQFSIDGGVTFQGSPIFSGVSPGTYQVVVVDQGGCETTSEVVILACAIQTMYEVKNASGPTEANGSITIVTEGSSGSVTYSKDGGGTFQDDPLFENLVPGTYQMAVKDSVRCLVEDSVVVSFASAIVHTTQGQIIRVYPNPSEGVFNIEVTGLPGSYFVEYHVLDVNGRIVRTGEAGSFNGILKAAFALNTVPSGLYYLRFIHPELNQLVQLVKQ